LINRNTRPRIRFDDVAETPPPEILPPLDRPNLNLDNLSEDQRSWVENGVVIKRRFIPDSVLDPYIARRAAFRPGTAWNAVGWLDGNCYEGLPELRDIALYPPLLASMKALISEQMILTLALTGWISTERDWHQDDYLNHPFVNTWYAAVWIALDTITPQSGPFEYVPGSHRWPLIRGEKVRGLLKDEELGRNATETSIAATGGWPKYAEYFLTPAIEEKISESGLPVIPFLAEKGDILIWHSRLMHRGSKRAEGWTIGEGSKVYPKNLRRSLITHYSGITHRPPADLETHSNGALFAAFRNPMELD
jgi:hypothetical protein